DGGAHVVNISNRGKNSTRFSRYGSTSSLTTFFIVAGESAAEYGETIGSWAKPNSDSSGHEVVSDAGRADRERVVDFKPLAHPGDPFRMGAFSENLVTRRASAARYSNPH